MYSRPVPFTRQAINDALYRGRARLVDNLVSKWAPTYRLNRALEFKIENMSKHVKKY